MNPITYRKLGMHECGMIKQIDASQYIHRAWREVEGERQLVVIDYQESDFPEGYDHHLSALSETLTTGGFAFGAFAHDQLVGFCSVNRTVFGESSHYVLLDQLFISNPYRGKGIGKQLVFLAAKEAKEWGADKLYICAASAEETIAFYFAIGCEEAKEINQALYLADTRDYQLEFDCAFV